MSAATFDTLKLSRRLEAAGFSRKQSTGMAEALNDALGNTLVTRDYLDTRLAKTETDLKAEIAEVKADLTTEIAEVKADLAEVKADLKAEIAEVKADLKADIARVEADLAGVKGDLRAVEYRLTIKLGGMMMVTIGAVTALVKLL